MKLKEILLGGVLSLLGVVNAQDFGSNPDSCKHFLSIYQSWYKDWEGSPENVQLAKDAEFFMQKSLEFCPAYSIGTYQRGTILYQFFMDNGVETEKYYARGVKMFDLQKEHMGNAAVADGAKGQFMYQYGSGTQNEGVTLMKSSIDQLKEYSDPYTIFYAYTGEEFLIDNEIGGDIANIIGNYAVYNGYLDQYAVNNPAWAQIVDWVKAQMEITFVKYAKCDDVLALAKKSVTADASIENKEKWVGLLGMLNCTSDQIFLTWTSEVCEVKPSLDCYMNLALGYAGKGNYSKAAFYGEKVLTECGDCEKKNDYLDLNMKLNMSARKYAEAKKIAQELGKQGYVYLITAQQIAAKSTSCSAFDQKAMYWLAYDYAAKAKALGGESGSQAASLMNTYKSRFPTKGDIFDFLGGGASTYKVTCWNNESTDVRER